MAACSSCGGDLPEGAVFCPVCGARALDSTALDPDVSPSHFNAGVTSTLPGTAEGEGAVPPLPAQEATRRPSGRRRLALAAIAILVVLLVGVALESGYMGPGAGASGAAVNSASDPFTGGQLYSAYSANLSKASASYTNKTVYIQDTLDFGVGQDANTGQFYSTVDSGAVVLFWSSQSQSQLGGLFPGATVLARCSVQGVGPGSQLYLEGCDLISAQSQSGSATASIPVNNE
ncbi:MAG: zinc ribbon domain-containing protein [Nitrososphaerota archaeon]|nr:zinc ribbon domain-containing protein [Nitrososphaerota archaeon]MDG7021868.1 zinc ribbon domain-containing protein [Nitrososphaerota archaeon]